MKVSTWPYIRVLHIRNWKTILIQQQLKSVALDGMHEASATPKLPQEILESARTETPASETHVQALPWKALLRSVEGMLVTSSFPGQFLGPCVLGSCLPLDSFCCQYKTMVTNAILGWHDGPVIKVPQDKPNNMSLIPGAHTMEGES